MLAFGLGTLPALLAFGQVATALGAIATTVLLRLMGLAVALLGLAGLLRTLITIGIMTPVTLW
jgi:sulfite exporter TauE/SafE